MPTIAPPGRMIEQICSKWEECGPDWGIVGDDEPIPGKAEPEGVPKYAPAEEYQVKERKTAQKAPIIQPEPTNANNKSRGNHDEGKEHLKKPSKSCVENDFFKKRAHWA